MRLEITHALARGVRVVPILVEGAKMPAPSDLPADLSTLAGRRLVSYYPSGRGRATGKSSPRRYARRSSTATEAFAWVPLGAQGLAPLAIKLGGGTYRGWFLALFLPGVLQWGVITVMLTAGAVMLAVAVRGHPRFAGRGHSN